MHMSATSCYSSYHSLPPRTHSVDFRALPLATDTPTCIHPTANPQPPESSLSSRPLVQHPPAAPRTYAPAAANPHFIHRMHVAHACRYLGTVRVDHRGASVAFRSEHAATLACERREFAESLRRHAAATYPGRILFRYGCLAFGADLEGGVVTLKDQDSGDMITAKFDLLIGADGENSRVRGFLEDQVCSPCGHTVCFIAARHLLAVSANAGRGTGHW